ncbi:hypothetical protein M514_09464, partial [Trichuris suis]
GTRPFRARRRPRFLRLLRSGSTTANSSSMWKSDARTVSYGKVTALGHSCSFSQVRGSVRSTKQSRSLLLWSRSVRRVRFDAQL